MTTSTPTPSRGRGRYITVLVPIASVLLILLAGEVALRTWHYFRWHISFSDGQPRDLGNLSSITFDQQLGWRATPNYRFSGIRRSSDGSEYSVDISQDENGFRMYGDLRLSAPRVFVIGDSFTQAVQVSDDKTFYAPLKALNMNVFAYGASGYGSLQEFMILDKYFDVIKPDLIIWEYSTNDIVNNSPELEAASTNNNNDMVRPYWVDGAVHYILPRNHATTLRMLALRYSRLSYIILNRLDTLRAMLRLRTVEMDSSPGEPFHPQFLRALAATDGIIGLVRKRAGQVPIVGFTVGADPIYGPEYIEGFHEVSQNHGVILADVEGPVLAAEQQGTVVRAADGSHWNEKGHHIAGLALTKFLSEHRLLEAKSTR
jgi:GDSL-like Lipase/Acylhydrolase family